MVIQFVSGTLLLLNIKPLILNDQPEPLNQGSCVRVFTVLWGSIFRRFLKELLEWDGTFLVFGGKKICGVLHVVKYQRWPYHESKANIYTNDSTLQAVT